MNPAMIALLFLGTSGVVILFVLVMNRRNRRVNERLKDLSTKSNPAPESARAARFTENTLSGMGAPLVPNEAERTRLQLRLLHAGQYEPRALTIFLGVKMLLMAFPVIVGLFLGLFGVIGVPKGILYGLIGSVGGMLGPSLWLDSRKKKRQAALRRALPDALDVIVICLDGGLSLPGAFQRVVGELRLAHPLLASELAIVEREIMCGRSTGEALRQFADRCDLEEVRSLAAVVIQSERYGASLARTLRAHADSLRSQRLLRGEELAQKAAVKIVFPTLLFIFPAVFLVLAGPAMIQIMEMLASMNH